MLTHFAIPFLFNYLCYIPPFITYKTMGNDISTSVLLIQALVKVLTRLSTIVYFAIIACMRIIFAYDILSTPIHFMSHK